MMRVYTQAVIDVFLTNTYFYINEDNKHGIIIDPGAQADMLLDVIERNGFIIDGIFITHNHFDHIGAVDKLTKVLKIPFYMHKRGIEYIQDNNLNLSINYQRDIKIDQKPILLEDNEKIHMKNLDIVIDAIYTPGHSFDSMAYIDKENKIAFVGDILYNDNIGIYNFLGGNKFQEIQSINEKLCNLDDDVLCFAGHMEPKNVKFIREIMKNIHFDTI